MRARDEKGRVVRRWGRLCGLALGVIAALPLPASCYDARVTFLPVKVAKKYLLQIKIEDDRWKESVDLGDLEAETDGKIRIVVHDLPVGPTVRFAVRSRDEHGHDSERSNEREIHYADVAPLVDSDGDGLRDAEEDADLDRQVDPGETNPEVSDTDGDGVSDGDEVAAGTDPTVPDAPPGSTCGDGVTGEAEQCDDGNKSNSDGCLNDCVRARCGDRIVYEGVEECDDGNDLNGDACLTDCRRAVCGDGYTHRGNEQCDDGAENSDIADGACRTNCTFPECWIGDPDGICNDDNGCTRDVCAGGQCDHDFATAVCDDGIPCTSNDTCAGGACVGRDSCPNGRVCNFSTGQCERQATANSGLWLPAALYPSAEFGGKLTTGSKFTAGQDEDPDADAINPMLVYVDPDAAALRDATEYWVDLPSSGPWYLWGRFYYPGAAGSNGANSFFLAVDDQDALKFGNSLEQFQRWHWDGDGEHEYGPTLPLSLGSLAAGPHKLSIAKRETYPESPRIDVLFLTEDKNVVPNDAAATRALTNCPFGGCEDDVCGDANGNRVVSVVDAWKIFNATVGAGQYCRLSACDVNGNGTVETSDAMMVFRRLTGLDDADLFHCRPSVAFGAANMVGVDHLAFVVDYSNAGVAFTNDVGHVRCRHADPIAVSRFEINDDPLARVLSVSMDFAGPISGNVGILECFVRAPDGGKLPGPGAYQAVVTEVNAEGDEREPITVSVLPGG